MQPGNTTSRMFFYVYVLENLIKNKRYVGYTHNLKNRIEEHNRGKVLSTKSLLPMKLIYFEGCTNSMDAKRREKYLKTSQGRKFLGLRLIEHKRVTALGSRS